MTLRERFWRWLVTLIFGPRIACYWFGHPEEAIYTVSFDNAHYKECSACGWHTL